MSEAVKELVRLAQKLAYESITYTTEIDSLPLHVIDAAAIVESELNKSPAEQHQERLEEVLQWPR